MSELEPHYGGTPLPDRSPVQRVPVHVVLDNIRSAFNVGSIFRTADAGAVAHLHLCGMSAHPPHRKLEKTALGAFEYVPWTYYERTADCLESLAADGIHRVAIEIVPGASAMDRFQWPTPVAIVFGHEVNGINAKILALCDEAVEIPMHGHKNSLNVATAFGIVLYDILGKACPPPG